MKNKNFLKNSGHKLESTKPWEKLIKLKAKKDKTFNISKQPYILKIERYLSNMTCFAYPPRLKNY